VSGAIISVGAILAGGAGSRIGGGKAMQMLGDKPLVDWARGALAGCTALANVGDPEAADAMQAVALSDPEGAPDGPLSGLWAALLWAKASQAQFLVTVPCDTPFLPDSCAVRLVAAAQSGNAPIACARSKQGLEPLIAAWRVDAILPLLEAALKEGRHPAVHRFVGSLSAIDVAFTDHETTNINTPQALLAAEVFLANQQR
jgi:molybdenum cofactor guanylyltransferase